jgi:hypothetical protein
MPSRRSAVTQQTAVQSCLSYVQVSAADAVTIAGSAPLVDFVQGNIAGEQYALEAQRNPTYSPTRRV